MCQNHKTTIPKQYCGFMVSDLCLFKKKKTILHKIRMEIDKEKYIDKLKSKLDSYSPITNDSWQQIQSVITFKILNKEEVLLRNGEIAKNVYFVCKGALRAYFTNDGGDVYTKNIFFENDLAGSTVSSLLHTPSTFTLEALEKSLLISINYKKYRELIFKHEDLKNFYVAYLEKNWVIEKEQIEVSIIMENATKRYVKLLNQHPDIDQRIPQMYIASHLGITPTQLSRIRKELKK